MKTTIIKFRAIPFIILFVLVVYSCSKDSNPTIDTENEDGMVDEDTTLEEETDTDNDTGTETDSESSDCTNPIDYIFNEKDGLVFVEFEDAKFSEDWKLKKDGNSFTGEGYMVWEGTQHLGVPGNGTTTFKIKITNPGTYQFIWYSAVKTGNNGTDHNDTWLRFNDADDFYGKNNDGSSTVYPKGTGKTPNPEGATAEGWFKIYRGGNNLDFKWQASTFDNNGHNVYVKFNNPGTYLMEISARSSGHGIDKFALFNDTVNKADAISSTEKSVVSCN